MSQRRLTALLIGILIITASLGELGSTVLGRSAAEQKSLEPKASLERLQKKIPDLLNEWWTKQGSDPKVKSELKISRCLGPSEAKLTYTCEIAGDGSEQVILTFMLRHYDGLWTTADFRTNHRHILGADLLLLIDQAAAQ